MADTRTRIINLPEATTLDSSMNFVEDSADGSGTRRITYDTLKGAINQEGAVNLAPAYSNAATYNVGDLCTYQGKLYCCNTQISTAEDWTPAHWTATNMASDVSQLKSTLSDVYDTTITLSPTGDAVTYTANEDGGYWRFINGAWQKVKTSGVAYFHMVTYPVEGGKRYRVTGRHTDYCPLCTFWTDDGTTPIGYSQDGYPSDRTSEQVTLDVVVPAEATKMIVTAFPLSTFPTVYELELEDTGVVYTDAYIDSVKYLKTTGFHVWDRELQPFKYTREGTVVKFTFGNQFYVSGTISVWVKTITLNSDSTYTKTVSLNNSQHLVYNPATNDVEAKSWSDMTALSNSRNDYIFLGSNINGHLIGPISAIEMRDLSDRIDAVAYPLPYYYDSYMAGKVTEIEEACAFSNGAAFPFITDIHLQVNAKQSGKLIKYLGEHTNAVQFVVSGGDIPYATDTEENVLADAQKWLEYMGQWGKEKTIQVHGNHDYMCNLEGGGTFRCTVGQLHYYIADNGTFLERPVGALYGKYDVPNQKVRIIVTDDYDTGYDGNTWTSDAEGYSSEQLAFIKSAILETSKHIIVISHQTSDATMANYIHDQSLQTMLISAKNKTGEFANWAGDIVMHLSGHSHNDEDHVEDNLLSVATVCDAAYTSPSGYTRTWGTTTEQAFDVVCVDTTNKTINMIRIGAGSNREFTY